MIRAICVDKIHKTLRLGEIYHVEKTLGHNRVRIEETKRAYPSNAFCYVNDEGRRVPYIVVKEMEKES